MSLAIISPHLDDAIFSLGEFLTYRPGATIICPFAATPEDLAGRNKYNRLHDEHRMACKYLDLRIINGPFLDDVYEESRDVSGLESWLADAIQPFTEIWEPLGIHHPDHIRLAHACSQVTMLVPWLSVYEELPYRVLYPLKQECLSEAYELMGAPQNLERKKHACRLYESQIGEDIERCLYVPERLWKIR